MSFPRTTVGGVSVSRMIIGTNWILGWSHTSPAADNMITNRYLDPKKIRDILIPFLENGVDTIMGLYYDHDHMIEGIHLAEEATGKKMILIDTPILNVNDSDEAREEARAMIRHSKEVGSTFCFPHHSCVEQLVNKNTETIDRLPDYLKMIREEGMIPGLSAHMPEVIIYSDQNNYDVETYIQIYNCMGFLMQVEIEYINKVIWNAKKPVMTIKPMAAGRCTPFVGLNFSWATIRECDMITIGCFTPEEVVEDIEISRAALEKRVPDLAGRASPKKTSIMQK